MKLSLDAVSYSGYFYEGGSLTFEETIDKADAMGYDAVDLFPHRPMGFPMDLSSERRKRIKAHAETRGIELAVIEACTNFMMTDHILTQTQDKELLFVRECCALARDLGFPVAGMPRPSSSTLTEPSLLIITTMLLACPPITSSIALSTSSYTK